MREIAEFVAECQNKLQHLEMVYDQASHRSVDAPREGAFGWMAPPDPALLKAAEEEYRKREEGLKQAEKQAKKFHKPVSAGIINELERAKRVVEERCADEKKYADYLQYFVERKEEKVKDTRFLRACIKNLEEAIGVLRGVLSEYVDNEIRERMSSAESEESESE